MTQLDLDATTIKKPSRLVLNILGDLRRYCGNKGCTWQGTCDLFTAHSKTCSMRSREVLLSDLQVLEAENTSLAKKYEQVSTRLNKLQLANKEMSHELSMSTAKLRVYDAFFSTNNNILRPDVDASLSKYEDINEFYRLRGGNDDDDDDEEEEEDEDDDEYDEGDDDEREYLEGDDGGDDNAMYPILAEVTLSSRLRMDEGKPSQRYNDDVNGDGCGQKSTDSNGKGTESAWTEINRLRSLNSFQLAATGGITENSSSNSNSRK